MGEQNNILQFYPQSKNQQHQKLIRFQKLKLLGAGAEGCVFLAQPLEDFYKQESVAIKIHNSPKWESKELYEKLQEQQQQIERKNSIEKSQIIKIYELGLINNQFTTIMEVGELDLFGYYQKNKLHLDLQKKQNICLKLAYAIKQLHELQYIHRDIKPENFIVVKNDFKLIDFGLAKEIDFVNINTMKIGSRIFQAPELLVGDGNYSSAVDIWALGCTFFEILTFTPLINAKNLLEAQQIIENHKKDQKYIYNVINLSQLPEQWKKLMIEMVNPIDNDRIGSQQLVEKIEFIINPNYGKFLFKNPLNNINKPNDNRVIFNNPHNFSQQNNNQQQQNNSFTGQFQPQNFISNPHFQQKNFQNSSPNQVIQPQNNQQFNQQNKFNADTKNLKLQTQNFKPSTQTQEQYSYLNNIKQQDDKIIELERKIQQLDQNNATQNREIEEQQRINQQLNLNNDKLNEEIVEQRKIIQEKNQNYQDQNEQISRLENDLEIQKQQIYSLEEQNSDLKKENNQMRTLLEKYQKQFESSSKELEEFLNMKQYY